MMALALLMTQAVPPRYLRLPRLPRCAMTRTTIPLGAPAARGGEQKNKQGTAGATASTDVRKKKKIKPVKVRNPVARSLQHRRWAHALPRRLHTTAKSDRVTGLTWV